MTIRLVLTTVALVLGLSGLAVALCIHRYQHTEQQLLESRLYFIVNELRTMIQTGLDDLELQLDELSNLQDRLREDVSRDPLINAIVIFDDQGRILFAASAPDNPAPRLHPDQPIPPDWRQALSLGATSNWQARELRYPALGVPLTSNFGQPMGGIALQHRYRPQPWRDLLESDDPLLLWALLVVAGAVSLTFLGSWWIAVRTTRPDYSPDHAPAPGVLDPHASPGG